MSQLLKRWIPSTAVNRLDTLQCKPVDRASRVWYLCYMQVCFSEYVNAASDGPIRLGLVVVYWFPPMITTKQDGLSHFHEEPPGPAFPSLSSPWQCLHLNEHLPVWICMSVSHLLEKGKGDFSAHEGLAKTGPCSKCCVCTVGLMWS